MSLRVTTVFAGEGSVLHAEHAPQEELEPPKNFNLHAIKWTCKCTPEEHVT